MQIDVNISYVDIVSKMKKLANTDVKTFRTQLAKIRTGLAASYKGKDDISSQIMQFEKGLDVFANKVLSLAAAFNQGVSEILENANQTIRIGEVAPLSKELDFILSNPTTAQMIMHNVQILMARQFTEKYKNGVYSTSSLSKAIAGGLYAGASTMALLPLLNTDSSAEGVDSWFKKHNSEEYTEYIKTSPGFNTGIAQPNNKACVYSSKANILNRRRMLDTGDTSTRITEEQVQSTFKNFNQKDAHIYNQFAKEYAHNKRQSYSGTVVNGYDYFFNVDKSVNETNIRRYLDAHPEGIAVYSDSVGHAITITDYELKGDGSVQYYAMDPAKAKGYSNDRIRIEETWTYSKTKSSNATAYLNKFNYIINIE